MANESSDQFEEFLWEDEETWEVTEEEEEMVEIEKERHCVLVTNIDNVVNSSPVYKFIYRWFFTLAGFIDIYFIPGRRDVAFIDYETEEDVDNCVASRNGFEVSPGRFFEVCKVEREQLERYLIGNDSEISISLNDISDYV